MLCSSLVAFMRRILKSFFIDVIIIIIVVVTHQQFS